MCWACSSHGQGWIEVWSFCCFCSFPCESYCLFGYHFSIFANETFYFSLQILGSSHWFCMLTLYPTLLKSQFWPFMWSLCVEVGIGRPWVGGPSPSACVGHHTQGFVINWECWDVGTAFLRVSASPRKDIYFVLFFYEILKISFSVCWILLYLWAGSFFLSWSIRKILILFQ